MASFNQLGKVFSRANPGFSIQIEVPQWPYDVAKRRWNQINKDALREVLQDHHDRVLPRHFQGDAHQRYGYAERSARYKAWKQKRGRDIDLVKSGRSQQLMMSDGGYQIVMGGAAAGGAKAIEGKIATRFAFVGGTGATKYNRETRQQVNTRQMLSEIQRFTADESKEAAKRYQGNVLKAIETFRAERKRVRFFNDR